MFQLSPPIDRVSVDLAHTALLLGIVASLKPSKVLELGFEAGYTTDAIVQSLKWNQKGSLTVVDNWDHWEGQEPPAVQPFRDSGVEFIASDEGDFVRQAESGWYDLLVSDADHSRSDQWLDEHLRIVRPGGILFFHDTNNHLFPNLAQIVSRIEALDLPYHHFMENSRADERCDRGWLMVKNKSQCCKTPPA